MITYHKMSELPQQNLVTFFETTWGNSLMAIRGELINLLALEGYAAMHDERIIGLVTYRNENDYCEIVSLDSLMEHQGIGSQLMALVEKEALQQELTNLRLITTNDNLTALSFYQKRGYNLHQLYPNAVAKARQLKPSIPLIASNGIPVRDELELRKDLSHDNNA